MSELITLVEIDALNKATNTVETLRFCDGLAYRLRPSENPANALYRPFLADAGWSRVDIYSRPGDYGHVTLGQIVLNDASGELGAQLINYAFDGRRIVQRVGIRGAIYPDSYTTVLNGTQAGQPSFNYGKIVVRPADLTAALGKPLQTQRYAGSNVLPAGMEGVDDIKGRVKPIVLALASNMSPVLVNTSKLIYQVSISVSTTLTHSVTAVRDKGVPLTADAAYASVADLLDDTKAPAAGHYRVLSTTSDGCYVRLGSSPVGQLTLDAAFGATADRSHAQVWARVLQFFGNLDAASISAADVMAMDAAIPGEIEYALFEEVQIDNALREVANSSGASWYGDPTGVHRLQAWSAPSGSPVDTITALRTESMDIIDSVGNGAQAPAYLVTVSFGRNWTVQADSYLGGDKTNPATDTVRAPGGRAGLVARNWLNTEFRSVSSSDASVKAVHTNAIELQLQSLLSKQSDAQTFSDALLAMYKVDRHMMTLTAWLSPTQLNTVRTGTVVTIKEARWGYDTGRLMRVAGIQPDLETGKTILNCWG